MKEQTFQVMKKLTVQKTIKIVLQEKKHLMKVEQL